MSHVVVRHHSLPHGGEQMGENLPFRSLDDVDGEARCDAEQMRLSALLSKELGVWGPQGEASLSDEQ